MIKWDSTLEARMVQHMQINKCDTPHEQNEGQKSGSFQ